MKKNTKNSPNRLTCKISGATRISNKTYIADKAYKHQCNTAEWKANYICKSEYKKLVAEVASVGFAATANQYNIDKDQLNAWLRFNGRGAFVKIAKTFEDRNKETAQALAKAA